MYFPSEDSISRTIEKDASRLTWIDVDVDSDSSSRIVGGSRSSSALLRQALFGTLLELRMMRSWSIVQTHCKTRIYMIGRTDTDAECMVHCFVVNEVSQRASRVIFSHRTIHSS